MPENRDIALYENVQYDQGQQIGQIEPQPFGEGYAFAGIRFFDEVVPAPLPVSASLMKLSQPQP